ncbi:ATP-binding protein [Streptomyces sp. NBC_00102]|uniref:ATP-binding protein n=1 Tax=Streptomyces sp. NBC_00102 TaxID=2975652 RepID=UPI00224C9171|nr:ATP-binding protein [Streptomyces sp. NBC_00102]MCX5397707.1 ATP-binding protein [Streptomyces sp. NBC_00102]
MRPSTRSTALTALVSAVVSGSLCVWAASVAPDSVRTPLAWGAGAAAVALTVAVTVAAHALGTARALREARAADSRRFTDDTTRLVSSASADAQRFTAEAARIKATLRAEATRAASEAATALAKATADAAAAKERLAAETDRRTAENEADRERFAGEKAGLTARLAQAERERSAALATGANAASRMQALATSMLADLREMENRHTDENVLGDLLHLDHRTAQAGRLADSVAVLTGARSGRRWARPIGMESILRGAMGRISGYRRIRLHSTSDVAIAGHAAEGVMHALAELLDNAANFSPPTAEVHVYVEEVPAGVVITVEDSGLVMSDVQLRRAERAVSPDDQSYTSLTGTRLGLAVVGRLAHKHGLRVSFRPSARGGTGALLMLPQELISRTPQGATAPSLPAVAPKPRTPEPEPAHSAADPGEGEARPGTGPEKAQRSETAAQAEEAAQTERTENAQQAEEAAQAERTEKGERAGTGAAAATGTSTTARTPESEAESTGSFPQFGESGLPRRRRGRTFAAAESRAAASAPADTATPRERADVAKRQAERFSTFSQAVRANAPLPEGNTR